MTSDPSLDISFSGASRRKSDSPVSSFLRPSSVGLILLAFGVFFWGFGYKLSLYHVNRQGTTRASVVRMWDDSKSARTHTIPPRTYAFAVADLDWARQENPFLLVEVGRTAVAAAPRSVVPALDSLLPSRAPPAHFSGLQG